MVLEVHPKKGQHTEDWPPRLGEDADCRSRNDQHMTKILLHNLHLPRGISTELQADQNLYCEIVVIIVRFPRVVTTETIDQ